ncbi:MAG: CDP-diacylglycerol--glycerol-3-phosphate 3-phosphatidyltransferase [Clostridia bacterium]|nr:CDP-diacylglycerol--glycerol-3-phosphate 3-phosphatidyltransferase [Clostridia bacterium]
MNLPNKLTTLRLILIPFFMAAYYINFPFHYFAALFIFALASITDFFDGKIARKYNLVTDLGKFMDPIADKVLVISALVIMLGDPYPSNAFKLFGTPYLVLGGVGVVIIVARELMVTSLRMIAAKNGQVLAAEYIGKVKTFVTDVALVVILVACGLLEAVGGKIANAFVTAGLIGFAVSVILTIWSGVSYLIKNASLFKTK